MSAVEGSEAQYRQEKKLQRKWVVVTTVNRPTPVSHKVLALASQLGWQVVIVGDRKTPSDWGNLPVVFLDAESQRVEFPTLAEVLPWDHYCRKNLGYLYAMSRGADCIYETDDDNEPIGDELFPSPGEFLKGPELAGGRWVNVYHHFGGGQSWPRGLPLDRIRERGDLGRIVDHHCPVQQGLADEDPDVDAIYRLVFPEPVAFARGPGPVVLARGSYTPFNSQNTLHYRSAFPLLYLPCFVSFRVTDIWRSLVAQRVLWELDCRLAYMPASVRQRRNVHDLMRDFGLEVDGYLHNDEIVRALEAVDLSEHRASAHRMVAACWDVLYRLGLLPERELPALAAWQALVESYE
jgi:hypothetical protein